MTEIQNNERAEVNPREDTPAKNELEAEELDSAAVPVSQRRLRPRLSIDFAERYALLFAWLGIIILFWILRPSTFGTLQNFQIIFGSQSVLGILALGLILPLVVGEFDLSINATLSLSSCIVAVTSVNDGWPLAASIALALAVGLLIGFINGFLVVIVGVNGFIATLGMGTLIVGITYAVTNYLTIGGVSATFNSWLTHNILGLPVNFYFVVLLTMLLWYLFKYTPVGRYLIFTGASQDVARLSGLRVLRLRLGAFVACSFLAAFAGVVSAGVLTAADPDSSTAYLLPAYAAAFLGSTSIVPGRFNPWGTFIAIYFLITGITGLELLGLATWIQDVFYGAALVVAVTLSRLVARRTQAQRR